MQKNSLKRQKTSAQSFEMNESRYMCSIIHKNIPSGRCFLTIWPKSVSKSGSSSSDVFCPSARIKTLGDVNATCLCGNVKGHFAGHAL